MNTEIIRRAFGALTSAAFAVTLGGCAAGEDGSMAQDTGEETVAEAAQASVDAWTAWFSEEKPTNSGECDNNSVVTQVKLQGGYSDDLRLYCKSSKGKNSGDGVWQNYISEESPNNSSICGDNKWVVGMRCEGSNCDNVSIRCATFTGLAAAKGCTNWTGFVSEEQGATKIGVGMAVRGVQCKGKRCDEMNFCLSEYQ